MKEGIIIASWSDKTPQGKFNSGGIVRLFAVVPLEHQSKRTEEILNTLQGVPFRWDLHNVQFQRLSPGPSPEDDTHLLAFRQNNFAASLRWKRTTQIVEQLCFCFINCFVNCFTDD